MDVAAEDGEPGRDNKLNKILTLIGQGRLVYLLHLFERRGGRVSVVF